MNATPATTTDAIRVSGGERRLEAKVLLAEDNPDVQRLHLALLRKAGADVVAADNGQIAVELAMAARDAGEPFDVILMDIQMPVTDGYEATRRLRAAGYTGPIIAVTAYAMENDRQLCLDAGCDDYLSKPVDRGALLAAVARYLRKPPAPVACVAEQVWPNPPSVACPESAP